MTGAALADRGRALRASLVAHPRHVVLGALVGGLLAGPWAPVAGLVVGAVLGGLARRGPLAALAVVAGLAGAVLAQERVAALERTALRPDTPRAVTVRATVLEPVRTGSTGGRTAVVAIAGDRVLLRLPHGAPGAGAGVHAGAAGGLGVGRIVAVRGRLGPPDRHAGLVHAVAVLRADAVVPTGDRRGGPAGAVDRVRDRAQAALAGELRPGDAALLRGMVLGDDSALPSALREAMRDAGLSHLVAASGQNVVLLSTLVLLAGALLGVPWRWRLAAALALVALYVPLAGGGPSIRRAGVMGAAGLVAMLAGRPSSRWYALLLAAAVTLALDPRAAQDVGWQLSFAAVGGIMLLAPGLRDGLERRGAPRALAEATAMTVAATLSTAPLLALVFGETSLVALPANVLATPLVAPVMWIGALAAAAGQLSTPAGAALAQLAAVPLALLVALARTAAAVPAATVAAPAVLVGALAALAAVAVRAPGTRPGAPWLALGLVAVALATAPAPAARLPPPAGLRLTALDIGQGDAVLVQHGPHAVLVDAGPPRGGVVGGLRRLGVQRLDVLVATHAQDDHIGGAPEVLAALPVGLVLDGRDGVPSPDGDRLAVAAAARGTRLVAPDAGQVLRAGPIVLRVLSPRAEPAAAHAGADPNDRSIVLELRADGLRALLAADAESGVLSGLPLGPVDVLKVSHHGSADEGLPGLLARLRPRVALVSAGEGNRHGHPTASTMSALAAAVPVVARTDRDGSVVVDAPGGRLRVRALG